MLTRATVPYPQPRWRLPRQVEEHLQLQTDPALVMIRQHARLSSEQDLVAQVRTIASLPTATVLNTSNAFRSTKIMGRGGKGLQGPHADVFNEMFVRGLHDGERDRSTWSARLDYVLAYQPTPGEPCNLIHAGQALSFSEYKSHMVLRREVLECGKAMEENGVEAYCSLTSQGGVARLAAGVPP